MDRSCRLCFCSGGCGLWWFRYAVALLGNYVAALFKWKSTAVESDDPTGFALQMLWCYETACGVAHDVVQLYEHRWRELHVPREDIDPDL